MEGMGRRVDEIVNISWHRGGKFYIREESVEGKYKKDKKKRECKQYFYCFFLSCFYCLGKMYCRINSEDDVAMTEVGIKLFYFFIASVT